VLFALFIGMSLQIVSAQFLQDRDRGRTFEQLETELYRDHMFNYREFIKNIEGTPYWNEEFREATVFLKDDITKLKYSLRYNNLLDLMEIQRGDTLLVFSDHSKIDRIVFDTTGIKYCQKMKTYIDILFSYIRVK